MLLTCLFCKKEKKLFNICYVYGSTQRPIKEFILEFFGPVVRRWIFNWVNKVSNRHLFQDEYLSNEQGLCSACVFVFNNLIFIQNVMRETIKLNVYSCHEYDTRYEVAYKKFLNHLNLINYDENRSDTESRSSSPELLKATRSSPFTQSNDEYSKIYFLLWLINIYDFFFKIIIIIVPEHLLPIMKSVPFFDGGEENEEVIIGLENGNFPRDHHR